MPNFIDLKDSDGLFAIVNGSPPDEGVMVEVGIAIALGNTAHASSNHVQYDSLRIKISQMLIFGIQDVQKVMEADSMLEAYADRHLGGVIIFEKNITKKRSKHQLKILIDEIQRMSQMPSFIAIDEEGGKVNRLTPVYGFHETKSGKYLGNINNLDSTYYYAKLTSDLLKELGINVNFAPTIDLAVNKNNFIN